MRVPLPAAMMTTSTACPFCFMRLPVMTALPRIIRVPLLVLLFLLGGCSAMQTGYNNAPSLLYWWLDGYVDFNAGQADPVRDSLVSLQAWHRREELPAYATLLQRLQQDAGQDITPELACSQLDQACIRPAARTGTW